MLPKQHVHFNRNVGGVNFGRIQNMLELFEVADGHNFDIRPGGGYSKRDGCEKMWENALYNPDTGLMEEQVGGYPTALCYWYAPDTSRHLVWFHSHPTDTPVGLVSPYSFFSGDIARYYVFQQVPRGDYFLPGYEEAL